MTPADEAYRLLAPLYDAFTCEHDYEQWTSHLERAALRFGLDGRRLLDLACGTGKSFAPFLTRGYAVTGCDISREMLDCAARKAPQARLVVADIRTLGELGAFDLVICLDDALNYLLRATELLAAFRAMRRNLAPHGLAVFDVNTVSAYRSTFATTSAHEQDGVLFVWRGEGSEDAEPGCLASATIEAFQPTDGGLYERVQSRHTQRHYPRAVVESLLEEAGIGCLAVFGQLHDGSLDPEPNEERHHKLVYLVSERGKEVGTLDHQEERQTTASR